MTQDHTKEGELTGRATGDELTAQDLAEVTGGADKATGMTFLRFDFKLVAVKTISWS